jgi:hypothetical protein
VFGEDDHSKRSATMYDCVEFDDYPGNIGSKLTPDFVFQIPSCERLV